MELIRYDAMCSAIAECHRIDEVKDLRDKAMALELYAKQARNTDAERKACEIRLRAERRTGELLKELARADKPNPDGRNQHEVTSDGVTQPKLPSPYAEALQSTGISRQTAHRYQALANVPSETFESALRDPEKPTTTGVLAKAEATRVVREARDPAPKMPADSLWLWGRLRDLERDGFFTKDASELLAPMTESMLSDMRRLAPLAAEFFNILNEATHELA
ncbi:MAG: hypothetical protein BroJett024_41430 [Alphaproteobacteria bacterium]|nr:MAG: hypothetical protein BroJett024_41430 [Alphaproteobacteria bacterium]